jgi:8-oxo-dGTP diphosphatase
MKTQYSVGFAFNKVGSSVVLIKKLRPAKQFGKWNGVGGHVEAGERFADCMVREFREETGVETSKFSWEQFGTLKGGDFDVAMFSRFEDDVYDVRTMTDEAVELWPVQEVLSQLPPSKIMSNLRWIIPAAIDRRWNNLELQLEAVL